MNIVHIIQRYWPAIGGAETWCRNICRYVAQQKLSSTVLTLDAVEEEACWDPPPTQKPFSDLAKTDHDGLTKIIRCKVVYPRPFITRLFHRLEDRFHIYLYGPHSIEMYFKMIGLIKKSDIIHLHTLPYTYNFIAVILAKFFKKKIVITPHFHIGHPQYETKSIFWLLRKCDQILAVTDLERAHFVQRGINENKISVVNNAIDINDYTIETPGCSRQRLFHQYDIALEEKVIIFIGRKMEYKGLKFLVDSIVCLSAQMPLRLFLIGPDSSWFKQYYSGLSPNIKERIIDFGVVAENEKIRLLHAADLLVLPSEFEAFGIVLLEAWACGIPVLSSDRGVLPDIVGKGGLVFRYGDSNDLCNKMKILLSDPVLSCTMAQEGKSRVMRQYNLDQIGLKIVDLYQFLAFRN